MAVDVVTFSRPEKHNALNLDHLKEVYKRFRSCENPVVIYGEPSFCSGIDVDYVGVAGKDEILEFAELANNFILDICRYPKPVVAFVKGYALGAGFSIALACDAIIAEESAVFSTGFAKLGIAPDMGVSYLLPRAVGLKRALKLLFSAERFDARKALELGIVSEFGTLEDAKRMAEELNGPSVRYIKELVYRDMAEHVEHEKELALRSIMELRGFEQG
ncbi:Enoyl-CoA hydratase/carnithine racemase [Geoglobus ahangari]|uniref:Enoyl-CoA hydratase/carnithine racemase n=1 Tax=Geoglobus ahangari TaxID=113653 RepID=A0A0F7DBX8_9EURY|nr:enoyl-CoA hydratase/isomerase family protein [Geoglobus ahangari]AKG91866.1 Enoyl-CoA hydratase/carnithine racemase [Geoglobus ahangari]